nr:MAG TPA: DNA repair and recombination protein, Rad51, BRC repeat, recombinase [Bacteriophage sp.]
MSDLALQDRVNIFSDPVKLSFSSSSFAGDVPE